MIKLVVMANGGHVIINRRDFLKIALGGGAALAGYKLFQKDIERILYGWGNAEQQPRAPLPVANETAVPTATPAPDYLMYDGIKVIGDEQFQKDNVMWMEFAKRYSLPDYEFIKSNNKWINNADYLEEASAGGDGIRWNKKFLRELIKDKRIKTAVGAAAHETGHNTVFDTDRMNEDYAQSFAQKVYTNLSYVNQSEIDKFYQEFNFSQFKK